MASIDDLMLQEISKPVSERNIIPMLATHCPGCTLCCGNPDCPLSQAKWKGIFKSPAKTVKSKRTPEPMLQPQPLLVGIKPILQEKIQQLSLFGGL
jgi:hypothetical protein